MQWIRKAVAVNPEAHFGRETWQVVLEEFLLAALDDSELLLRFDMVGNRLDADLDQASGGCFVATKWLPGSRGPNLIPWNITSRSFYSDAERATMYLRGPMDQDRPELRTAIASVGAEKGWRKAATWHQDPVPFDEPALAIVGMWRLGAGANPHFAVALGEIMLRVGLEAVANFVQEFQRHRRLVLAEPSNDPISLDQISNITQRFL